MNRTKRKQAHTQFARGQKVLVVLKDDSRFVAKFIEKRSREIVFEGRIQPIADIRTATIYRTIQRENKPSRAEVASHIEMELKAALGSEYEPKILEVTLEKLSEVRRKQRKRKSKRQ